MSYNIALTIYQGNPARGYFRIVEQTVFTNGSWSDTDGIRTLTIGNSGTSGVVRFVSDKGENITVAVGVHNYKRWTDIVPNLASNVTALVINGEYYNDGTRSEFLWKQLAEYSITSDAGTKIEIKYTVAEGNDLKADVTFS